MKIIQIGPFPLDPRLIRGGVEASIYGLSVELAKNHEVIVFDIPCYSIQADGIESENNLQIYRFKTYFNRNIGALARIPTFAKLITELKPEVCHLHTTSLFSLVLVVFLKIFRIKTMLTVHGLLHIEKRNILRKKRNLSNLLKYIQQSVTEFILLDLMRTVIVDTQYVSEEIDKYRRELKIIHKPVCKVIPQGINPLYFDIKRNAIVKGKLLSVGAISRRKGHLMLLESIRILKQRGIDVKLMITGIKSEPEYYNLLLDKIHEYDLKAEVSVSTDLPLEEIVKHYADAEIFVLHTQEESQGIVFCEAMAVGLPVVATNVGGVPWVIEHGLNGLLCDYGDCDQFATNILELLSNSTSFIQQNIQKSMQYNWSVITKEVLSVYQTL